MCRIVRTEALAWNSEGGREGGRQGRRKGGREGGREAGENGRGETEKIYTDSASKYFACCRATQTRSRGRTDKHVSSTKDKHGTQSSEVTGLRVQYTCLLPAFEGVQRKGKTETGVLEQIKQGRKGVPVSFARYSMPEDLHFPHSSYLVMMFLLR